MSFTWESKIVVKPSLVSDLFRKSHPDLQSTNQKDLLVCLESYPLWFYTNPYSMRRKTLVQNGRSDRKVVSHFLKCFDWKEWQKNIFLKGRGWDRVTLCPLIFPTSFLRAFHLSQNFLWFYESMHVSHPMKWVVISTVSENIILIHLWMKYLKSVLLYLSDANLGNTESTWKSLIQCHVGFVLNKL